MLTTHDFWTERVAGLSFATLCRLHQHPLPCTQIDPVRGGIVEAAGIRSRRSSAPLP